MRSFTVIVPDEPDGNDKLEAGAIEEILSNYGWTVKVTRITDEDGE